MARFERQEQHIPTLKDKYLSVGTVIEEDGTWCILEVDEKQGLLTINQNTARTKSKETVAILDGRDHADSYTFSKPELLASLKQRIDHVQGWLRGTKARFAVIKAEMDKQGWSKTLDNGDIWMCNLQITAQQLDAQNNIDPDGLRIQFFQNASRTCVIDDPTVVGRLDEEKHTIFVPFTPEQG